MYSTRYRVQIFCTKKQLFVFIQCNKLNLFFKISSSATKRNTWARWLNTQYLRVYFSKYIIFCWILATPRVFRGAVRSLKIVLYQFRSSEVRRHHSVLYLYTIKFLYFNFLIRFKVYFCVMIVVQRYQVERKCFLAQIGGLLDNKGYGIVMKKSKFSVIN